ncbi:MAG TPA: FkbM family methyltransferase [Steroidobacteraceae bacterium]|nr:FkbM family methyltransferase [Steroidobacteraceae bacterium]
MRKLLNRLLAPTGYRIERVSRFQRELHALAHRADQRLKFVQIGANDGVRFDGLYGFVTQHPCSGIVVEPLPDMFERLRANYADYPQIVPVNKAIHATAAMLPLFRVAPEAVARYPGWASGIASFDRSHLLQHGIAAADTVAQPVACIPLMELLRETAMLDADLLQIDAEGYDSAILQMTDFARFRPHLIKYEHKAMTLPERTAHVARLKQHGYSCAAEGTDTIAWQSARS